MNLQQVILLVTITEKNCSFVVSNLRKYLMSSSLVRDSSRLKVNSKVDSTTTYIYHWLMTFESKVMNLGNDTFGNSLFQKVIKD